MQLNKMELKFSIHIAMVGYRCKSQWM